MFDHNFGKINKLTDKTKEGRKRKKKWGRSTANHCTWTQEAERSTENQRQVLSKMAAGFKQKHWRGGGVRTQRGWSVFRKTRTGQKWPQRSITFTREKQQTRLFITSGLKKRKLATLQATVMVISTNSAVFLKLLFLKVSHTRLVLFASHRIIYFSTLALHFKMAAFHFLGPSLSSKSDQSDCFHLTIKTSSRKLVLLDKKEKRVCEKLGRRWAFNPPSC